MNEKKIQEWDIVNKKKINQCEMLKRITTN